MGTLTHSQAALREGRYDTRYWVAAGVKMLTYKQTEAYAPAMNALQPAPNARRPASRKHRLPPWRAAFLWTWSAQICVNSLPHRLRVVVNI